MNEASQLQTAARAVHAALDYNSSPEARLAASTFLESLKTGDVHVLGATASALVKEGSLSSEVRHYGLKLLQYLVRMRWEELTVLSRSQLTDLVLGLILEIATTHGEWFLKSQTASLMAEVVRHEDISVWSAFLSRLMEMSALGPAYAEVVLMVLRWLPEDITVYNEDLEGDRRRQLVQSLTQALPQIFPFFFKMLENHFLAAVNFLQRSQEDLAKQHAAVANGTLNALLAYVEWAPVDKIAENGLIDACGFLLNAMEFRQRSCEIIKQIVLRKRPLDESSVIFDAVICRVFEVLSQACMTLTQTATNDDDSEFLEYVAEAMVAIGSQHLQCFVGLQSHITTFLQLMLGFYEHKKIGVHFWALLFWLGILRDIPSGHDHSLESQPPPGKLGIIEPLSKDKKGVSIFLADDLYTNLLQYTFKWYFQNSSKVIESSGRSMEEISDPKDYGNYRSRLVEAVRLIAVQRPYITIKKIAEKAKEKCDIPDSPTSTLTLAVLDCVQKLLEATINAVFGGEIFLPLTEVSLLQPLMEELLGTLLNVKWRGSAFVETHGRLLDALGPFLKTSANATLSVLNKIFELLISLPVGSTSFGKDPSFLENSRARLQVCTSLLRIAKAADRTVSVHLEVIWRIISSLQEQGLLLQGELNLIAEAFLVAGSAAGKECEAKAFDCFLSPIQSKWKLGQLQERFLIVPENLVSLLAKQTNNSQNEEMWSIFHSIVFTERVVKRCANQHSDIQLANDPFHPIKIHMKWIIMPLLQIVHCIHALWSPKLKHSLPSMVHGALRMSFAEQVSIIGEAGTKSVKGNCADVEIQDNSYVDGKETEVRNWLKGIRDSSYSLLGLAATCFTDIFFDYNSDAVQVSLLENIEAMEYRHMRLFLHFVLIPIVKSCPAQLREVWLNKLLPSPLNFCESVLSFSWRNLLKEGSAKLSDDACKSEGLGIKEEVLEEKLLRDLSRETCILLAVFASPSLNPKLPSGDQLLQAHSEPMKPTNLVAAESESMMRLILQNHDISKASLSLCIQALKWPDSEAVHKALLFCGAAVSFASICCNAELQTFVATDLFATVIEALTVDSNASAQAEFINLFRIIYLLMAHQHPGPRQILQCSPSITGDVLLAFENALTTTLSSKEQRHYIKSLLKHAGGGSLIALTNAKTPSSIINVSNHPRPSQFAANDVDETGNIGLAAFM